jgi:hypothetical protein
MTEPAGASEPDLAAERTIAVATNNATWDLLGRADRSVEDDDRLVHMAHASAYHWSLAGNALNAARAEYLCSHVYAVLGRGEPALHHAARCLAITEANRFDDFDLAYAHEAMARALAVAGLNADAATHLATARSVTVADAEDRALVEADLAAGPWYGVDVS